MAETSKKILIVEDDEDFISILKMKFNHEGFSVVVARNGEEGVAMAEKEKPDLIISDVLMPQMDGLEMAKKIKEKNNSALIVFLTNTKDLDYKDNMNKVSEFEYWIKSDIRIGDIVDMVRNKLGLK